MKIILLKTLLNLPLIALRIILIIFDILQSIIESVGRLIIFVEVIMSIWYIFEKDYFSLKLNVFAIIFVSLIQIGAEFILNSLVWIYEKIYIYKIELG
ncbi:MAG: hypothetical protein NSGCLCUN01_02232 [uncultured Clostridium sp.]